MKYIFIVIITIVASIITSRILFPPDVRNFGAQKVQQLENGHILSINTDNSDDISSELVFYDSGALMTVTNFRISKNAGGSILNKITYDPNHKVVGLVVNGAGTSVEMNPFSEEPFLIQKIIDGEQVGFFVEYDNDVLSEIGNTYSGVQNGYRVKFSENGKDVSKIYFYDPDEGVEEFHFSMDGMLLGNEVMSYLLSELSIPCIIYSFESNLYLSVTFSLSTDGTFWTPTWEDREVLAF